MISRKRIIRISDKVTIPILKAALTSNRPMLYSPVSRHSSQQPVGTYAGIFR